MASPFEDIFDRSAPDWAQLTGRLDALAEEYRVPRDLVRAVVKQESNWDINAVGDGGRARGWFQLHPGAAKDAGIDPTLRHDPWLNMLGGVRYLRLKLDQAGGNVDKALRLYNGGGDPNYVANVRRHLPQQRQQPGVLTRAASILSPASAEAATPTQGPPPSMWDDIFGPQTPPTAPAPPTARSTPEQDAAFRASRGQQAPSPGSQTPPPPGSQTPPPPATQPGGSQGPPAPSPAVASPEEAAAAITRMRTHQAAAATPATPAARLERFQQLPAITALSPPERQAAVAEFQGMNEAQQRAVLASEPAADLPTAVQEGPRLTPEQQLRPEMRPSATEPALEEGFTKPSTMIPLLMGGAGLKAATRVVPETLTRLARPVAEGLSQTLGWGTGRTIETGEVPSAGELATTGAVATAVGGAQEALAPVVAKVGNALRGVVKPAYQEVMDLANKYGIRLSYGDVSRGSVAPKVEAALEAIPGSGAGRFRVRQQAQVGQAGETLRGGLKAEMGGTTWRDLPTVQRAAAGTGPRAKEAQALLAEIEAAGDDWGRVIQVSGKLNIFQDRLRAEALYDKVETLAQPLGNMRLPKTTQAIDDAMARATDDVLPSPEVRREVIGALTRIKGELSPTESVRPSMGVRDPATGTLRAEAPTVTTTMPDTSYSRMRRLYSALGDLQREAAEPTTARYLSGVKTALNDDMAAFAQQSNVPALRQAHKAADTFYRTRVVPYREGQLAKAIERDLPDEIYPKFVRAGKDRAEYFYKGLDPRGQAAVRYGMVQEAFEKATSGPHPDVFSPARFAGELRKMQEATGVFFKGAPQWEINGVTKLMQYAQRAGQYAENPPTGLRGSIGTAIAGTGAAVSLPAAVTALLSTNGLRMLFMTRPGRNFLLAASDLQPGSAAWLREVDRFIRTPAAAAIIGAATREGEGPPRPPR